MVVVLINGQHEAMTSRHVAFSCVGKSGGMGKEKVYLATPKILDQLKDHIRHVLVNIPSEFLLKSVDEIVRHSYYSGCHSYCPGTQD